LPEGWKELTLGEGWVDLSSLILIRRIC